MTIPYTYLIGWPEHNIWYYGVRYATGCHPSDLWNPYTTSSKHVNNAVTLYGVPPVRQIRKIFNDGQAARLWESNVLKKMNVVHNAKWLNKTDTQVFEPMFGDANPMRRDEVVAMFKGNNHPNKKLENRTKISISHKAKGDSHHTKNPEFRNKMKEIILALGNDHPMKRPENSGENHPMKLSKNRNKAKENNTGKNNPMFGKTQKKKHCDYCNQDISINTYPRWHGERCKKNSAKQVEHTDDSVYNKS